MRRARVHNNMRRGFTCPHCVPMQMPGYSWQSMGAAPAPPTLPSTGIPAPPGGRPIPGANGTQSSPGATGNISPAYVGLAVTVAVFAAMVIWQ